MNIEMQLRDAFRETAETTPVPDRLDAILAASGAPRRRAVLAGSVAVAAAVVLALVVSLALRDDRAVVVRAGPPSHAAIATFPNGPAVTLDAIRSGRLAFVSGSRAYVVDGDRHTARQLTRTGDASGFAWSADGQWLAFSVRDAPGYEDYTTWITRADGSGARPLEGMDNRYSWSPAGHRLAIAGACCGSSGGGVYVVDPGHDPREIVPGGTQISTVVWSPDGATVGYSSSPVITTSGQAVWSARTVPAAGGRSTRIADGQLARFSPDGSGGAGRRRLDGSPRRPDDGHHPRSRNLDRRRRSISRRLVRLRTERNGRGGRGRSPSPGRLDRRLPRRPAGPAALRGGLGVQRSGRHRDSSRRRPDASTPTARSSRT